MDKSSKFAIGGADTSTAMKFEELQKQRNIKREQNESTGVSRLIPTCSDMCPEFERYERELHLDVHPFEVYGDSKFRTGEYVKIDHKKAVKKYHRPAAGNEVPLPEDVRTPEALLRTQSYLFEHLLANNDNTNMKSFADLHSFIRDRTRSIRQDLTLQGCRDETAVLLHEHMARFHILSGHVLCEADAADFDSFQNTEQLRKVLQSLHEMYTDGASHGAYYDFEPEFRGYYILSHLQDPNVFRMHTRSLPPRVYNSLEVQFALSVATAFHQGNYVKFFKLVKQAQYLQACLMQTHFTAMRLKALEIMSAGYSNEGIALQSLMDILLMSETELLSLLQVCGLQVAEIVKVSIFSKPIEPLKPMKSLYVEAKRTGQSFTDICLHRIRELDPKEISRLKNAIAHEIFKSLVDFSSKHWCAEITKTSYNHQIADYMINSKNSRTRVIKDLTDELLASSVSVILQKLCTDIHSDEIRKHQDIFRSLYRDAQVDSLYESVFSELSRESVHELHANLFHEKVLINHFLRKWAHRSDLERKANFEESLRRENKAIQARSLHSILRPTNHPVFKTDNRSYQTPKVNFGDHLPSCTVLLSLGAMTFDYLGHHCGSLGTVTVVDKVPNFCPHLIIADQESAANAVSTVESLHIPWKVPVLVIDLCIPIQDQLKSAVLLSIDDPIPVQSKEALLAELSLCVTSANCSEMYRMKLRDAIEKSICWLLYDDPAIRYHPNRPNSLSVYTNSLKAVQSQLSAMILGLGSDSRIARTSSVSTVTTPKRHCTDILELIGSVKKSRRESDTFESRLLNSINSL